MQQLCWGRLIYLRAPVRVRSISDQTASHMSVRVESYFFDKNFLKKLFKKKFEETGTEKIWKRKFFPHGPKSFFDNTKLYIIFLYKNFSEKLFKETIGETGKLWWEKNWESFEKKFLHPKSKKIGTKTFASKIQKKKKTPLPRELGAAVGEARGARCRAAPPPAAAAASSCGEGRRRSARGARRHCSRRSLRDCALCRLMR